MANAPSEHAPRIYCLVGFMGAGKSTVGRRLADRLGWTFVDLDERIEAAAGRTIPEIFEHDGEAEFRDMERRVGEEVLAAERLVIATGGGWGAVPGRISDLPSDVRSVWLRVSPEVAVTRTGRQAPGRPLLDGADDPVARATELLDRRTPHYRAATVHIDTEGRDVEEIVDAILDTHGPDTTSGRPEGS